MNYKVGDVLRIKDKLYGHKFASGESVTVLNVYDFDYRAQNGRGDVWFIEDSEVMPALLKDTFKVGDVVEVVNNVSSHVFATGEKIRITALNEDCYETMGIENGHEGLYQWLIQYEIAPIEPEPAVAPVPYKKGDIMMIIGHKMNHGFKDREFVTFMNESEAGHYFAKNDDTCFFVAPEDVAPVMIKGTFKVGDKVVIVDNQYSGHGFNKGQIVTITAVRHDEYGIHGIKDGYELNQVCIQCEIAPVPETEHKSVKKPEAKPISGKKITQQADDMVNHPSHYTSGGIEVYDYIKAKLSTEGLRGYLQGNVLKYVSRAGKKGENISEDLRKARWYLDKWIDSYGDPSVLDDITEKEFEDEFEIRPISKKQIGYIAGLTKELGLDRANLPDYISPLPNYKELTEGEASELIERLLLIKGDK